jgi:hypothetical protein
MVKYILQLFFLVVIAYVNASAQDTIEHKKLAVIPINEAIDKGMLELKITGASDPRMFYEVIDQVGVYYGKCMIIILKSKIDSTVVLKLDCGTLLVPTDDSVQTMIVTHDAKFALYPNTTYATHFYAMCTQFHDGIPMVETPFRIGETADSNLVKLTKYIEKSLMQNMVGQHAVWAVTDQVTFKDLEKYGADSISIELTKEILDSVNINTKLNPIEFRNAETESNASLITINRYYVYGGIGLLFLLTITTITLSITRKKNNGDKTIS